MRNAPSNPNFGDSLGPKLWAGLQLEPGKMGHRRLNVGYRLCVRLIEYAPAIN